VIAIVCISVRIKRFTNRGYMSTYLKLLLGNLNQHYVADAANNEFYRNLETYKKTDIIKHESEIINEFIEYIDKLIQVYPTSKDAIIFAAFEDTIFIDVLTRDNFFFISNRLDILKKYEQTIFSSKDIFVKFLKNTLKTEAGQNNKNGYSEIIEERQVNLLNYLIDIGNQKNYFNDLNKETLMTSNELLAQTLRQAGILKGEHFDLSQFEKTLRSRKKPNYEAYLQDPINKLYVVYFDNFIENFKNPKDFTTYKESALSHATNNKAKDPEFLIDELYFLIGLGVSLQVKTKQAQQDSFIRSWLEDSDIASKILENAEAMSILLKNKPYFFYDFVKKHVSKIIMKNSDVNAEEQYLLNWDFNNKSYRKNDNILTQINWFFSSAARQDVDENKKICDLACEVYQTLLSDINKKIDYGINQTDEEKNSYKNIKLYNLYCLLNIAANYKKTVGEINGNIVQLLSRELANNRDGLTEILSEKQNLEIFFGFSAIREQLVQDPVGLENIDFEKIIVSLLDNMHIDFTASKMYKNYDKILHVMVNSKMEHTIHKTNLKNISLYQNTNRSNNPNRFYSNTPPLFTSLSIPTLFNELINKEYLDVIKNTRYKGSNYIEAMLAKPKTDNTIKSLIRLSENPEMFRELILKSKKARLLIEQNDSKEINNICQIIEQFYKFDKKIKGKEQDSDLLKPRTKI